MHDWSASAETLINDQVDEAFPIIEVDVVTWSRQQVESALIVANSFSQFFYQSRARPVVSLDDPVIVTHDNSDRERYASFLFCGLCETLGEWQVRLDLIIKQN